MAEGFEFQRGKVAGLQAAYDAIAKIVHMKGYTASRQVLREMILDAQAELEPPGEPLETTIART